MEKTPEIDVLDLAREIALFLEEKIGEDIVLIDIKEQAFFTDYFVICSASSARRAETIAEGIKGELSLKGIRHWHIEGKRDALWVLIDYGDVIVHIFHEKTRDFYNLERLWHDAPKEHYSA